MVNHPNRSAKDRTLGLYMIVGRSHGGNMGSIPAMSGKEAVQLWLAEASADPAMRQHTANTLRAERLRDVSDFVDVSYYNSLRCIID